jgi:murein L,D-transpeptidase YafK
MAPCLKAPLRILLSLFILAAPITSRASAASDPFLAFFLGYSKAINAVAISPNGRQAVTGGQDNIVRLWDLPTGLLLRTLDAQAIRIYSVAFSPDGQFILAAGAGAKLRQFAVATGQIVNVMEGHAGDVLSVAFAPSGRQALSGGRDKTVKLWDLETGQLVKTLEGHSGEVTAVAFSSDGGHALSASSDKTLKVWDLETGRVARTLEGHADAVTSLAISPNGEVAVSGSKDKTIKLWDAGSGQVLKTFEGHSAEAAAIAFSKDGGRILSGSADKTLKLWDVKTGALLKTFEGHADAVASVAFSADGSLAVSGSADKTLKIWDVSAGRLQRDIDLEWETFSPNGYRDLFRGASAAKTADPAEIDKRLREKGLKRGDPVFLRLFKADREAELWMKGGAGFVLFATYPICAWSGQLGPKLAEGDAQAPEGFYTIGKGQLNPNSRYHRAFNLGYPNLFDRAHDRTGANIMMHGACASIGCYAMTDASIDELWLLVTAALDAGQEQAGVHAFPFRMTDERLAAFAWHPWAEFWRDLKPAYDLFEKSRIPPQVSVCDKRYVVQPGRAASAPALQAICPRAPTTYTGWAPEARPKPKDRFPG